jgi:long-subunit fatty acid transport protein
MRFLWSAAILLTAAASARAQDQQLGARTKAMGGSYTAFEDDPVSVWLNPAGISTQPDQMSLAYQTYTAYPKSEKRGPGTSTVFEVEAESILADPAIIPSYIGFVFQLGTPEEPMALGFCFARPYLLAYSMDQISSASQTVFEPQNDMEQSLSRFRFAFAKDFRIRKPGEGGFLTHVSLGGGLDVGYERWEFREPTGTSTDSSTSLGFGAGVLVGVYDDTETLKINFGVAYQSAIEYEFSVEPDILPAFNMPEQLNVGVTAYLLEGQRLRVTLDVQLISWEAAAEESLFPNQPGFEDVVNFSVGFEYRVDLPGGKVSLYPRAGFRLFDAPWEDENNLPSTGAYKLVLDTDDEAFNIFTFGLGIAWTTEGGKGRSFDVAADVGGDAVNVALGYTHEF